VKARGLLDPVRYFGLARRVPYHMETNNRTYDMRQGEDECNVSRFLFALV